MSRYDLDLYLYKMRGRVFERKEQRYTIYNSRDNFMGRVGESIGVNYFEAQKNSFSRINPELSISGDAGA